MTTGPDGDGDPIVISRGDLTAELRDRGQCTCPPQRPDWQCPHHGVPTAQRVRYEPGDLIVISYQHKLSKAAEAEILARVRALFGDGVPAVVLDQGGQLSVAESMVIDPPVTQVKLRRRTMPDALRYLAGKLRAGGSLYLVAITMETWAREVMYLGRSVVLTDGGAELGDAERETLAGGLHLVARWVSDDEAPVALADLLEHQAREYERGERVRWPNWPPSHQSGSTPG